jgi:aminoglycoside 6'-N-acetyltransferase I
MNTAFSVVAPENVPLFAELYATVFNAPPWQDGWSIPAAAERLQALAAAPRFQAVGAYQGSTAIGLVLGSGERWVKGWVLHLREMFIAPGHQRSGIGRALLAEFERSLAGKYVGVYLQTGGTVPAKDFYARCGYAPTDLVSMRKRIEV